MKNNLIIPVLLLITGLLVSCTKDKGPYILGGNIVNETPTPPTPVEPTIFPYTITYGLDVKPVLQQNCIQSCHSKQHPKLDLRPPVSYDQLLTLGASAPYVNTIDPKQSILYLHLAGIYTPMPKDKPALSQGKIDSIYTWISQGALNN